MPVHFRVTGHNDFYEGWVAAHFEQPYDESQTVEWRLGYNTAQVVPKEQRKVAFELEVRKKRIRVEVLRPSDGE